MTNDRSTLTPDATRRLTTNVEPWMSCDDCFDHIDGYLDRLLDGKAAITPQLRAHLIGCAACFQEAWSLLLLLAEERGTNPRQALAALAQQLDHDDLAWPDPPVDGVDTSAHR